MAPGKRVFWKAVQTNGELVPCPAHVDLESQLTCFNKLCSDSWIQSISFLGRLTPWGSAVAVKRPSVCSGLSGSSITVIPLGRQRLR